MLLFITWLVVKFFLVHRCRMQQVPRRTGAWVLKTMDYWLPSHLETSNFEDWFHFMITMYTFLSSTSSYEFSLRDVALLFAILASRRNVSLSLNANFLKHHLIRFRCEFADTLKHNVLVGFVFNEELFNICTAHSDCNVIYSLSQSTLLCPFLAWSREIFRHFQCLNALNCFSLVKVCFLN